MRLDDLPGFDPLRPRRRGRAAGELRDAPRDNRRARRVARELLRRAQLEHLAALWSDLPEGVCAALLALATAAREGR